MIKLHQFARTWGIPNLSFFCAKIETYLRMAKIPYEIVEDVPLKAPRGKLPYIEDNGQKIADSRLIVHHLKASYGADLDAHLSTSDRGIAKALERLVEEHLYWVTMVTRWNYTAPNWEANKQAIFGGLPPMLRDAVAWITRRRIKSQILGHGMGRLTEDEVFQLAKEDLDALADFLGDKPYFMGDRPSSLDACAYGGLINTLGCPIESPAKKHALSRQNLVDYCHRMQREFFPELAPLAA
jgi:glutathione S-transferase